MKTSDARRAWAREQYLVHAQRQGAGHQSREVTKDARQEDGEWAVHRLLEASHQGQAMRRAQRRARQEMPEVQEQARSSRAEGLIMEVVYLAHPVRPVGTETLESNLRDAERWLVDLQRANPRVAFIAPWLLELRLGIGRDDDPTDRSLALDRCFAVAGSNGVTAFAACGPRVSPGVFGELRSAADPRPIVVHRFRDRGQSMVLAPRHRARTCDFSHATPWWLGRCLFGAAPGDSVEIVGAEILAAYERVCEGL